MSAIGPDISNDLIKSAANMNQITDLNEQYATIIRCKKSSRPRLSLMYHSIAIRFSNKTESSNLVIIPRKHEAIDKICTLKSIFNSKNNIISICFYVYQLISFFITTNQTYII